MTKGSPLFSYRFPIQLEFTWPRLVIGESDLLEFPLAQLHSGFSARNLTLLNPSNASVLFQVMLAANYSQSRSLLEFVAARPEFVHGGRHLALMRKIIERASVRETEPRSHFRLNLRRWVRKTKS